MFGRPKNEIELLRASLGGNTQAFGVLVGRYQSLVCAITYSATGSVERSEELAQEAFLKAWKSLTQLEDLSKFRAWLSSITRNTVQNWHRSQQRDVVGTAAPLERAAQEASEGSGPVEAAMIQEQQTVVSQALAQIPESLREPLVLFYREQKSVREVARQLGLSENAARQRISRARSMLREQVADMVETTIARTRPGKAFTTAVLAAVAGAALKTSASGAAAGAGQVAAATGSTLGAASLVSSLTAKLTAVAAGTVLIVGSIVAYRQFTKPASKPTGKSPVRQASVAQNEPAAPVSQGRTTTDTTTATAVPSHGRETTAKAKAASAEMLPTPERPGQIIAPPGDPKPFEFKPKGVLSGVITDAQTGEPVRDALVRISMQRIFDTRADANGFYYFEKIHQDGNFDIAVDSKQYIGIPWTGRNAKVHLSRNKQVVKHFQLTRACMLDLWVVDANGTGIKDAKVVATSPGDSERKEVSYFGEFRKTDPNGYILLGGFPPAETEYLITAWHQTETRVLQDDGRRMLHRQMDHALGKATVHLTDPNVVMQVRIVLAQGQQVHGYAEYADGVPATDVEIVARPAWWHCNYGVDGWKVGADGTFTLKHITPGVYDICYYIDGTTTTVMQRELPVAGGEPLIVHLPVKSAQSLVAISGRFTFVGDKKPEWIDVHAYAPDFGHARTNVGSGPDGFVKDTFVLDRLEPGTYRLRLSGNNIEETVMEDIVAPSAGLEVEIVYASKPTLAGTVVDAETGEAIRSFRVRLRKLQTLRGVGYAQQDGWAHFENEHGEFRVEAVGPGIYQVQAGAEGFAPAWSGEVSTDEPEPLVVRLSAGGALTGRVVNQDGQPVSRTKVIPLSLAGGTRPREKDVFVSDDGAVETAGGTFTLTHLPAGTETLKVTHPDYAFATAEGIQVLEGETTRGVEIVLTEGGTVEGYVYDDQGAPLAREVLYFQDASGYGGSPDEEAGRLATAITDSNGFYRVAHLPEQLSYVMRANQWRSLGVVRRTVVPRNGRVTRLDFGGTPIVSGAVVVDGIPLVETKLVLGSASSAHFGALKCCTVTDGLGVFAFGGVAPGTHAIYYEKPGGRNEWLKIVTVRVAHENIDLGVIAAGEAGLFITFDPPSPHADWKIGSILLSEGRNVPGTPVGFGKAPSQEGDPWVINNVEPGTYMVTVVRQDRVQWRKEIELEAGRRQWHISLEIPKASAKITGRIHADAGQEVVFWRAQKDIVAAITPAQDGAYAVASLPVGRYFVGDTLSLLYDMPAPAEFSLREGENKTVDLDLSGLSKSQPALLAVQVVDENGGMCPDAHVRLDGPLGAVEPMSRAEAVFVFLTVPGEHTLHVEAPGYRKVNRPIAVKSYEPRGGKAQNVVVCLERP